ncbi:MAG: aldolase catalytic domain-containing protein [Christensenellaceae bacterium]
MNNKRLLDCTLRDGGYTNDWNFGHGNLINVFERLADAGIDFIEIGFLDDRRDFDIDRSIMPDTDCVSAIYGDLDKKSSKVLGMIDYGTCDVSHIKPCCESFLDGIRVIFKKHVMNEAMQFCAEVKKLGYMVFAQLVSVTSYSDDDMKKLIALANEVEPYAVSMVDTYGLMHPNNLKHYFTLLDEGLNENIGIGFHAHNNFQMGYANCIAMLSLDTERDVLVDGSLCGMGKSAGNAPIELVAMYMNENCGKNYRIAQLLEAVEGNISQFYQSSSWGYSMFYYLAAYNKCHPNYVSYLMDKKTLSVTSITEILSSLQEDKKLMYNKKYIADKYRDYLNKTLDDSNIKAELTDEFKSKPVLVLGPGATLKTASKKLAKFVAEKNPLIVSVNFISDAARSDFIFLSNSTRYIQLASQLAKGEHRIIATSNLTVTGRSKFDYVLNYSKLIDSREDIIDNPLIMFLKLMIEFDIKKVYLAGFDGYSTRKQNYIRNGMEYDFIKNKAKYINEYTRHFISTSPIDVEFLTYSAYCDNDEE